MEHLLQQPLIHVVKPEIDLLIKQFAASYMQKEYVDDMSLSLSDLEHLNETFLFPLQSVYLALNAYGTYYDLKQKSSVYLQKTLVFTKEREEVEKMTTAEGKREAGKTIPPLSRNASSESTYQQISI